MARLMWTELPRWPTQPGFSQFGRLSRGARAPTKVPTERL